MKPDFNARLAGARQASEAHWTEDRSRAVQDRIERRLEERRRRAVVARVSAIVLFATGLTGGLTWWAQGTGSHDSMAQQTRTLRDGSVIVLLDPDTQLRAAAETKAQTVIVLDRGRAEFRVTHSPERLFRVEAGSVAVQVLGTVFRVERREPTIRVQVLRGVVQVRQGEWSGRLAAGAEWSTPVPDAGSAEPGHGVREIAANPPEALSTGNADTTAAEPIGARADWREMVRRGQFQQAHDALRAATPPRSAPDLLLAADAARLSHHPEEAVGYLRALLETHGSDPRAALAAFTLGKVLLDDLGRPIDAARAFAQTQTLDPNGAMAEDALARQVEAYWRALDEPQAREHAERYLKLYPSGRRTRLVRRFGGME